MVIKNKSKRSDICKKSGAIKMDEDIKKEKYYKKIANKINRLTLWEIIDNIDKIEDYIKNEEFKSFFSFYQLDNFEFVHKSKEYIIWGCGEDGKKVYKLLTLLNKKIIAWCDKNAHNLKTINNIKVQTIEEIHSNYNNEIIIIASRKYSIEMILKIEKIVDFPKNAIFEYNRMLAFIKHDKEYRKNSILSYPPLWMTIGITSACTNHCLFCSYHGNDAKEISNTYGLPFMLSYQDFKKIVDMAEVGGVPHIHICGTGEPFFNPNILEMIDYVIMKYGEVSLQTDFLKSLFEKKNYLDELIKREKHITYIATDVLSSKSEEHDNIKRGASYIELLNIMDYIGSKSNLIIKVVVIITKQNYKNIKGIIDDFLKRNVNLELLIVNLLSYDYSDYTSSNNVFTSRDIDIINSLKEVEEYAKSRGVRITLPKPAEEEEDCYVFWREFQTWPVKGCKKERYGENMIPHACSAVVRGELNSIGYLFDYSTIMEAWNNEKLVKIRENIMQGNYPSDWCRRCFYYHGEDSLYKREV